MESAAQPMVLNGSHGEGGGALFRTALALSALTQQPVRVHNVRGATRKPGLSSEDLSFLRALEAVSAARLSGDDLQSADVSFAPTRPPRAFRGRIDVQEHEKGTVPGNALILIQSLLPVLARAGAYSRAVVCGETYNPNTLTYDAFERVTLMAHRKQGVYAYPQLALAGYGYGAHGEVSIEVEPSAFESFEWPTRGKLLEVGAVVSTSGIQASVGERGAEHAQKAIDEAGWPGHAEHQEVPSRGPGAYVTFYARYERGMGCGGAMGSRGVRIEQVVRYALDSLMEWMRTDATVDPHLADQLLLPAAMAEGTTSFTVNKITQRLITMAWVVKQFLPIHVTVLGREGEPGSVKVSR